MLSIFAMALATISCGHKQHKIQLQGFAQGSYYAITYYDEQGRNFQSSVDSIFQLVDKSVSLWDTNSIISKVNRNEDVELNDVFIDNFNLAFETSVLSDGYFDATIGPLVTAWGFSYKQGVDMTQDVIDSLRMLVDYRKVNIENGKVVKAYPSMTLDFNAIAQGYTSDLIATFLESQGVEHYLVDTGGEIMAKGHKPDGSAWIVGIEKPAANWDSEREIQTKIRLGNKGLVTSGNYRKYVERDGRRYSHSIDPKTGWSVQHNLLSVTVMADNSAYADALASVFMIMGLDKSVLLLPTLDSVEAFFIYSDADGAAATYYTDGFQSVIISE